MHVIKLLRYNVLHILGLIKELKRKLEEKEHIVLETSARHTSEECEQSGRYCSRSELNGLVICNKKTQLKQCKLVHFKTCIY